MAILRSLLASGMRPRLSARVRRLQSISTDSCRTSVLQLQSLVILLFRARVVLSSSVISTSRSCNLFGYLLYNKPPTVIVGGFFIVASISFERIAAICFINTTKYCKKWPDYYIFINKIPIFEKIIGPKCLFVRKCSVVMW